MLIFIFIKKINNCFKLSPKVQILLPSLVKGKEHNRKYSLSFFRPDPVFRLQYMVAIVIYAFQYCLETSRNTFNPIQLCVPLTLTIQKNTRLEIVVTIMSTSMMDATLKIDKLHIFAFLLCPNDPIHKLYSNISTKSSINI